MSQTRIYLPLSASRLRELADTRQLTGAPLQAYAVTASVERLLPAGDEEEWEYAALCEAVAAASELREKDGSKRVVAAADVDPEWVRERTGSEVLAAVEVLEDLPLRHIVSFHIDEQRGAEGAEDLLWYDATELDEVTRLM